MAEPPSKVQQDRHRDLHMQLGRRIRFLREAAELSQTDVAKIIGVVKQSVSAWERGITSPQVENIFALATLLGVEPAAVFESSNSNLHGPTSRKLAAFGTALPCVSEREAGSIFTGTIDADDAKTFIATSMTSNPRAVAIEIRGRANYPRYQEGDFVLLDPDGIAEPGQMVLASVAGEYVFRRYKPAHHTNASGARLVAMNQDYPTIEMAAEDRILAVMLAHTTTRHD